MNLLDKWGADVVEAAQRNIGAFRTVRGKRRRTDTTGTLRKSLGYLLAYEGDKIIYKFTSDVEYAAYINKGVSGIKKKYPTRFSFKGGDMPSKGHVDSIMKWMKAKPLRLRDPETGSFVKSTEARKKSAAFGIARSIRRKGIEPTYFMDDAILDGIDKLEDIMGEFIEVEIDEALSNGNN